MARIACALVDVGADATRTLPCGWRVRALPPGSTGARVHPWPHVLAKRPGSIVTVTQFAS